MKAAVKGMSSVGAEKIDGWYRIHITRKDGVAAWMDMDRTQFQELINKLEQIIKS